MAQFRNPSDVTGWQSQPVDMTKQTTPAEQATSTSAGPIPEAYRPESATGKGGIAGQQGNGGKMVDAVRATASDSGPDVCQVMAAGGSKMAQPGSNPVLDGPTTGGILQGGQSYQQGMAGSAKAQETTKPAARTPFEGGNVASGGGSPVLGRVNLIGPDGQGRPGRQGAAKGGVSATHPTGNPRRRGK